jgi:isochorismate synthase
MSRDLQNLVERADRLYALLEPTGPLRVVWGADAPNAPESLSFRKFHFPQLKTPSAWKDFGLAATWSPGSARDFKHREVPQAAAIPRPAAAPKSSKEEWAKLCASAAAAIQSERAHKLVPARELSITITKEEHDTIFASLASRLFHPQMENAYRFLVRSKQSVFFGGTPELLFKREGGMVHVPAIAGTRAITPGMPESSLREELLASEKDRAEHEWVVDGICESLRKLGLKPTFAPSPVVLRVPRLLHLYTPITAVDDRKLTGEKILEALHPTPAIGGHPRDVSREFLFHNESWDRGLFSAPLLFRRPPASELCLVAIRSGLLTPERLHFFAGAGYVRGSTPESEWLETERKLQVMQTVLFGEPNAKH